jgi:2-(1,2-epoxy-1,2-dihydrophenyl)acetyl-CoA isomerase
MTVVPHGFAPWRRFETMSLERTDTVARITLNRPDRLNALNRVAWRELPEAVEFACSDRAIGVLILTGAGRAFCSGADADDMLADRLDRGPQLEIPEAAGREWSLLSGAAVPVIAAVNGPAAGAGLGLALMADFRLAADTAFFTEAHVARGLTPSIASWYLPRFVGLGRATEMILLDQRLSAAQALEWGLVNAVVPAAELADAALGVAGRLAALPRFAMLTARESLRRGLTGTLSELREWSGTMEALALALSTEAHDGRASFRSGRGQQSRAEQP